MTDVSMGDVIDVGPAGDEAYRRLVEGATDDALFMLDPEGVIVMWPDVAHALYGYGPDEMLGSRLESLFADLEQSPHFDDELLEEAKHHSDGGPRR